MQQDQPYLKPLAASSMATNSSYFAPLQQKQKMEEFDQQKKEKLSCLHSRLHQEADKISKWKTRVEMELKQKDSKIQEGSQTIESLRKSILELQLQNESLSLKLQEEMSNREVIMQKIEATRTMCNLLKEYAAKLEDRMKKCETNRTELKYQEKEHLQSYEVLSEQYKELQEVSLENYNTLAQEVTVEQEAKKIIEKKYKEQIIDAERELKKLLRMTSDKDKTINEISQKLEKNQSEICKLTTDRSVLKQKLDETSKQAESQLRDIAEKNAMLKSTRDEKERLDAQLEEVSIKLKDLSVHSNKMTEHFNETEKLYADQFAKLQEEVANREQSLQISVEKVRGLEGEHRQSQQVIEELKSAKDMLQLDKAGLQRSMENIMRDKDSLEEELRTMHQQSNDLSSTATEKDKMLNELRMELSNQEKQLAKAQKAIDELQSHLAEAQNESEKLSSDLTSAKKESNRLEKQIQKADKERGALVKQMVSVTKERDELCAEKEKLLEELEDLQERAKQQNDEMEEMKSVVQKLESEKESLTKMSDTILQEESKNGQVLANQLEISQKECSDLENKVASLKQDLFAKNKQVKELEKEAKATKRDVTAKEKKLSTLEGKLETSKVEIDQATAKIEEIFAEKTKLQEVADELTAGRSAAEEKVAVLEEKAAKAVQEKEAAEKELENTTKHMAKSIDDYKLENDKVMKYRMERLEALKADYEKKTQELIDKGKDCTEYEGTIKNLETLVEERNNKLNDLKQMCSEFEATNENQKKQMESLKHAEADKLNEIVELKSQITAQEQQINSLKKDVKTARAGETAKKNKKVSDLEAKSSEMKTMCATKEQEIIQLKESEIDKDARINELSTQITTKDQEIEDLKKHLEAAESKDQEIEDLKKHLKAAESKDQEVEELKKQLEAAEIKPTMKECSTPNVPPRSPDAITVDRTPGFPSRLPKTPQSNVKHCEAKTPLQSGIVRSQSSSTCIPKRRKVAFSTPKSPQSNSDSDGMEVDISEVHRRLGSGPSKGFKAATPLIRKSTPKIQVVESESPEVLKPKPVPRARASLTQKARASKSPVHPKKDPTPTQSAASTPGKKTKTTNVISTEMDKFNELFPSKTSEKETELTKNPLIQNLRTTPSRAPGKFFKSRDRQKLTKAGRTQKETESSWVDLDAVFGFGLED